MHRTRTCLFVFLFVIRATIIPAQSIGNDPDPTHWINYSQTYIKIPIAQNGLYRITAAELQQAGVPVNPVNPITFQLFHRGVEQAIYVEGEPDQRFDAGDFIEFYGRANDGDQDSLLYRPHSAQPHTYYSLFSDTTAYFLTWRLDGKAGKRMVIYSDTTYAGLATESYHWEEELRLFTDTYPGWAAGIPPKIEYSYYEAGEGYTGTIQQKNKSYTTLFQLTNLVRTAPDPQIDVLLVGRDLIDHRVDCRVGPTTNSQRLLDTISFSTYDNARIREDAGWNDVSADGQLFLSTVSRNESSTTDNYSVSYIQLRYPQRFTINGQTTRTFRLALNPTGRSRIDVVDAHPATRFWDISDPTTPRRLGATVSSTGTARFVVRGTDTLRTLLAVSQPKSVPSIRQVRFTDWRNRKPTYLIISHEALTQPIDAVRDYARYRASAAGGGYDTLTVTMQQLIDQYSYGERHPLAIRRFTDQLLRQSEGALQYLLLLGRSRSIPGIRHDPNQALLDLVMTGGFPGSDVVLTAGLNGEAPDVPAVPTGRINAGTSQEVIDYLNKVKEYESLSGEALWRKNLLHLSGGETPTEVALFRQLMDTYQKQAFGQSLGAQVTTLSKTTDKLVESIDVVKAVNEGIGLMTFFGHSGLDVTDLDIGFSSNDALGYRNKGKYPLLLVNGCAIGNFFFGRPTLATDWVLTPNRGAIAAIAHSHLGYPDVLHQYSTTLYTLLADSTHLYKSIGQLQQETIRRILAQSSDGRAVANCQQMVLQGDPAIRLFPFKTPDYIVTTGGLSIQDTHHQRLSLQSDSVQIQVVVQNAGQYRVGAIPVRVRRFVHGRESGIFNWIIPQPIAYRDTLILIFPNAPDTEGQNQFEVTINPADSPSVRAEKNHSNNQATTDVTLVGQKPILIYPAPNSVVKTTTIRLTANYATTTPHTFDLELDSTTRFDSPLHLTQRITAIAIISYPTTLPDRPNTTYYWRVRRADYQNGSVRADSGWATGSFTYAPNSPALGLPEGQIRLAKPLSTDIQQGDVLTIPIEFTNLSPYPFADSLIVQQTIYASGLSNPQLKQWKVKALNGTDTLRFSSVIATETLPGYNRIILTVNPRLQPEYSFQNNTLDLAVPVQADVVGPLLEVAFDGARITDGSVVSAQPVIDVLVTDDNRSLIRRDTTGLDLYVQRPGKNSRFERLSWQNAVIQATEADNVFRIRYVSPSLTEGNYHLLVTARDAVGNRAVPYQVRFQVINAHRLTDFTIYPNPFRDQTRFAFTLSGDHPPQNVTIALTDQNGHLVRRLHGSVRIGLNEWTWDGRSDSGALLPAGVYLYKIVITDPNDWPMNSGLAERLNGRIILLR
ncbi:putative type IX secretion system sortase PorU2 [Spirosoma validum]|uniref:Gingipain domain-containing protein n=1 Tax=Spirosoma validum TaxID=2771355 RepID=A0A927GFW1_9BACT|nr:C25 family cysteine peptidase [Spirosoma validum]MBD2756068.1 hypothetical protein [Spirosoma validum]